MVHALGGWCLPSAHCRETVPYPCPSQLAVVFSGCRPALGRVCIECLLCASILVARGEKPQAGHRLQVCRLPAQLLPSAFNITALRGRHSGSA